MAGIDDTARLERLLDDIRDRAETCSDENAHEVARQLDEVIDAVQTYRADGGEICLFKVLELVATFGDL